MCCSVLRYINIKIGLCCKVVPSSWWPWWRGSQLLQSGPIGWSQYCKSKANSCCPGYFGHLAKNVAVGQGEMRFGYNETTSNLSVVHIIISLISANVRNASLQDLVAENGSTNHSNQDMSLLSP